MKHSTVNRQILSIALPSIVSNITVPLLGLVDVTIVGHLGSAAYIGAIAVGGMLFNMIYWIFGFLRMGTSGLTAQAFGRGDNGELTRLIVRSLLIGTVIALLLIVLQTPIIRTAMHFIDASAEVKRHAETYFRVCIWGAPAMLGLYSFTGWFIGMQNTRFPMYIAIVQNVVNIAASLGCVYWLGMKVEGVAAGTVIAQYAGIIMAAAFFRFRYYRRLGKPAFDSRLFGRGALNRFFNVNRDIFLRTLCLVCVTVFFTSAGAAYGDITLAVNTLLMQLFTLFSYIMDGFAYAGEALVGKEIGADDRRALRTTVRRLFVWGVSVALLFTLLYTIGGQPFLGLLTDDKTVIAASASYYGWAVAIPLAGVTAFILDGICIGATATRIMLLSMFISVALFFAIYAAAHTTLGNHALWMAFVSYLLMRGAMQTLLLRRKMPYVM